MTYMEVIVAICKSVKKHFIRDESARNQRNKVQGMRHATITTWVTLII